MVSLQQADRSRPGRALGKAPGAGGRFHRRAAGAVGMYAAMLRPEQSLAWAEAQ